MTNLKNTKKQKPTTKPKKQEQPKIANKSLFDKLIKRASQPLKKKEDVK